MKNLTVLFLLLTSITNASVNKLDSVLNSMAELSDSAKVDSLTRLSRLCSIEDNGAEGYIYANWALTEAYKNDFKDLIPKARFYLAAAYDDLEKYDSCAVNYDRALKEMKGTAHENWAIHVYINSVSNYRNTGQYEKALNAGLKALQYFEERNDSLAIAKFYTSIGYVYDRMQEFYKAIEWQMKSLKIFTELGDEYGIQFVNSRIGIAYDELGIYDSAHYYNQIALNFHIEKRDSFEIGQISSNIGNTYIKQKKWERAEEYLEQAVAIGERHGDNGSRAIAAINLGNIYTHLGKYEESKNMLTIGLKHADTWGGIKFQSEAYFRLHEMFEKQQIFDSSLIYFKKYGLLKDSLYSLKKTEQIVDMTTKYETEKKEQQIELQKVSLQEKEAKLDVRRRTIIALLIFCLLITVISISTYKRIKARKNAEMQQLMISEQEKGLKAVIQAQEDERKRISKDLHDGVGQQLSGMKMAFQKLGKELKIKLPETSNDIDQLTGILDESANEVRSISHQMMPRALTELGIIEAIEDMLGKSLNLTDIDYEFDHFGIKERLEERVEISLYRVAQELVNNIIKHSKASHVNVQLFKNQDKVILVVEDNGKGIDDKNSDGHGLLNIRSRVNNLHGELNLEPSPNSGTLATIRIPL